jgi:hypothetical protein
MPQVPLYELVRATGLFGARAGKQRKPLASLLPWCRSSARLVVLVTSGSFRTALAGAREQRAATLLPVKCKTKKRPPDKPAGTVLSGISMLAQTLTIVMMVR